MRKGKILCLTAVLTCLTITVLAERLKIEPDQRYLLVSTTKTKTMQTELEDAASQGFRIILASASKTEMVLFLERDSSSKEACKYLLLATSSEKTFEKELNEAAHQGFRLLPQTLMAKEGWSAFQREQVAILEQQPKSSRRYEYKVLATGRTGTLQKEVAAAAAEGFTLTALVVFGGPNLVIMEKETGQS